MSAIKVSDDIARGEFEVVCGAVTMRTTQSLALRPWYREQLELRCATGELDNYKDYIPESMAGYPTTEHPWAVLQVLIDGRTIAVFFLPPYKGQDADPDIGEVYVILLTDRERREERRITTLFETFIHTMLKNNYFMNLRYLTHLYPITPEAISVFARLSFTQLRDGIVPKYELNNAPPEVQQIIAQRRAERAQLNSNGR